MPQIPERQAKEELLEVIDRAKEELPGFYSCLEEFFNITDERSIPALPFSKLKEIAEFFEEGLYV